MRILHTSDWHLGKNLCGYSLLPDQQYFLDRLIDTIIEQRIELVIIAGDIYDRSVPPAEAVSLLDNTLWRIVMQLKVPVVAIAGNHDSAQRLSFASRMLQENGLYIAGETGATLQTARFQDEHGEIAVHLLPYFYPQHVRQAFSDDAIKTYDDAFKALMHHHPVDASCRNILVAHGFFSRLSQEKAHSPITSESELSVGGTDLIDISAAQDYDYVALGHLHAPQRAGLDTVRYSGSPLKYSVSESSQRKLSLLIDLGAKGDIAITELPVTPLRDLRIVRGLFEELLDAGALDDARRQDYISAEILDDTPILHAANRLRTVYPNLLELRFPTRTAAGEVVVSAASRQKSVSELFCAFYEHVKGVPISEELRQDVEHTAKDNVSEEVRV